MALTTPRGTYDILPEESPYFQWVEDCARRVCRLYGYREIRTPIFEFTELFVRGIGEETDIVSKEMYTFSDRKERSLTLRPEGTAPVVRAMVEHNLLKQEGARQKVCYIGPMFRYERPQAGRQRQFHQVGVEFFGCAAPEADAETIAMLSAILREIGFGGVKVRINSLGNAASRQAYNAELRGRLAGVADRLCGDCKRRAEVNPLRVLDCKVPGCKEAYRDFPRLEDFLDEPSRKHYDTVIGALDALGVPYEKCPDLVRGFDYYTHTVFEICLEGLGAQDAVLGGGRYDGLVKDLGGPECPAVGAGFGIERLVLAMKAAGIVPPSLGKDARAVYVLALEDSCVTAALNVAESYRRSGRRADFDLQARSFKAGLRAANREGIEKMVVIGGDELKDGAVLIKNLTDRTESRVPAADAAARE